MQLSVCFVLASSLLACLSYLYERSSEINYFLLDLKCPFRIFYALPPLFMLNNAGLEEIEKTFSYTT